MNTTVNSILKDQLAQERRYQLLQAAAVILSFSDLRPGDAETAVDKAEKLLEEIERRDQERRQA